MSIITINNVKARKSRYSYLHEAYIPCVRECYDRFMSGDGRNIDNFKFIVENWNGLGNPNIAFNKIMDAFELLAEESTAGEINTLSNLICETLTPKVRDGMAAMNYVKMKTRRFKTKLSTKINNRIEDNVAATGVTTDQIQSKLQVKNPVAGQGQPQQQQKKDQATEEAYNRIEVAVKNQIHCDRIINNFNTISKYINLNETFSELDLEDAILETCDRILSFNALAKIKYSTALETCWYQIEKYNGFRNYKPTDLVNDITMRFLFEEYLTDEDIKDMGEVLKNSVVFSQDSIREAYELLTNSNSDLEKELTVNEQMLEMNYEKGVHVYTEALNRTQALINAFKKEKHKTPEKLKAFITKFFTLSKNNIVDGTPNILYIVRYSVLLSTVAIHPLVACVALIANFAIKMHLSRKETARIREDLKKEIEKTKSKIEKSKSEKSKERLEEYLKSLQDSYKKVDDYYRSLHTDDENYERDDAEGYNDFGGDDDDFEFDFGDDDFNIESAITLSNELDKFSRVNITEDIIKTIPYYSLNDLNKITEFVFHSDLVNIVKFVEAMDELVKTSNKPGLKSSLIYISEMVTSPKNTLEAQLELFTMANTILEYNSTLRSGVVMEMNITNTLKLASEKLKKTVVKLSDKEKAASRTVDASLNTLRDAGERALVNDNREAIIRGSMLPSASKIIKGAILTGATYMINPAIAVIGVLGTIAVNKKLKAKERQLILDDIEVELKMCDKYIRAAEDNNDMEALRKLYQIEKNLQRQKQRIKYNMAVKWNQKIPNTASGNSYEDDDD